MSRELEEKVVLVTGAAKRVGRGHRAPPGRRGRPRRHSLFRIRGRRPPTAADCGGAPLFRANLENVAEIERMFADLAARFGRLDAVVNNAARFTRFDPLSITEKDWDFIHSVNLKAVFFCCQQAARLMLETGGGRIVNISSLGGIRPWADHAHYCASKAGVIMLTRALAKSFAPAITRELRRARRHPVRRHRRRGQAHDRQHTRQTRRDTRRSRRRRPVFLESHRISLPARISP